MGSQWIFTPLGLAMARARNLRSSPGHLLSSIYFATRTDTNPAWHGCYEDPSKTHVGAGPSRCRRRRGGLYCMARQTATAGDFTARQRTTADHSGSGSARPASAGCWLATACANAGTISQVAIKTRFELGTSVPCFRYRPSSAADIVLALGTPVDVSGTPLRLTVTGFADSRCPPGKSCVWQGELAAA